MSDLHRFTQPALYRSARGAKGKQVERKRQPSESPVEVQADFHLSFTGPEREARERFVQLEATLLTCGFSLTVDGPVVKPAEGQRPRSVR